MAVEIKVDAIPIEKTLTMIGKFGKQLPFAESKAINATAFIVQDAEIENIQEKFTTRTKWFQKRKKFGVNIKPFANKRKLEAGIGTRAPWLEDHEKGATKTRKKKTPGLNKSLLLIPVKAIRKNKSRLIQKKFSPAKLLANRTKSRVFFVETKDNVFLMQRKGKKSLRGTSRSTSNDPNLKVLFFAEKRAKIKPVLQFVKKGAAVIKKVYKKEFGRALGFAIKTAGGNLKRDK